VIVAAVVAQSRFAMANPDLDSAAAAEVAAEAGSLVAAVDIGGSQVVDNQASAEDIQAADSRAGSPAVAGSPVGAVGNLVGAVGSLAAAAGNLEAAVEPAQVPVAVEAVAEAEVPVSLRSGQVGLNRRSHL